MFDSPEGVPDSVSNDSAIGSIGGKEDDPSIFTMNNYFGIGIGAELCLDFHLQREESPSKFHSRWVKYLCASILTTLVWNSVLCLLNETGYSFVTGFLAWKRRKVSGIRTGSWLHTVTPPPSSPIPGKDVLGYTLAFRNCTKLKMYHLSFFNMKIGNCAKVQWLLVLAYHRVMSLNRPAVA